MAAGTIAPAALTTRAATSSPASAASVEDEPASLAAR